MTLNVFIYYTDGHKDYCFGCAVKEVIQNPHKKMDVEARDHSFESNDMRSDPECCKCYKRAEHQVIA